MTSAMYRNPNEAGAAPQGPSLSDIDAITVSPSELAAALQGAGALPGEYRVFTQLPQSGWGVADSTLPSTLAFDSGNKTVAAGARAFNLASGYKTGGSMVAGEYGGYLYHVYVLGIGLGNNCVEKVSIATGKTSVVTSSLPFYIGPGIGQNAPTCVIYDRYLYIAGGYSGASNTVQSTVYRLDLTNPSAGWLQLPNMAVGVWSSSAFVRAGNKGYIAGGITIASNVTRTDVVQEYDFVGGGWTTVGHLPFGACENTQAVLLPDGVTLLLAGGYNGVEMKKYALFNTQTKAMSPSYDMPAAWPDRPRYLVQMAGHSRVKGIRLDNGIGLLVEYIPGVGNNAGTWADTGIEVPPPPVCVIGNYALSDGSAFLPATNTDPYVRHLKYFFDNHIQGRVLCYKLEP